MFDSLGDSWSLIIGYRSEFELSLNSWSYNVTGLGDKKKRAGFQCLALISGIVFHQGGLNNISFIPMVWQDYVWALMEELLYSAVNITNYFL